MKIKLNRPQRVLLSIVVLLVTSVAVMTLAFFNSTDVVTNKVTAENPPKIILSEPKWYDEGVELAKRYVPSITIPKDPYVTNLSEFPVYVRMKLTILDEAGSPITDTDRIYAILNSIHYVDTSTTPNADKQFVTIQTTTTTEGEGDDATEVQTTSIVCNNPNFYYNSDDGYYYYSSISKSTNETTKEETSTVVMTSLDPNNNTNNLFDSIVIPDDKDYTNIDGKNVFTYDLYFSTSFSIQVSAEAIYVLTDEEETFESITKRFTSSFGE